MRIGIGVPQLGTLAHANHTRAVAVQAEQVGIELTEYVLVAAGA